MFKKGVGMTRKTISPAGSPPTVEQTTESNRIEYKRELTDTLEKVSTVSDLDGVLM